MELEKDRTWLPLLKIEHIALRFGRSQANLNHIFLFDVIKLFLVHVHEAAGIKDRSNSKYTIHCVSIFGNWQIKWSRQIQMEWSLHQFVKILLLSFFWIQMVKLLIGFPFVNLFSAFVLFKALLLPGFFNPSFLQVVYFERFRILQLLGRAQLWVFMTTTAFIVGTQPPDMDRITWVPCCGILQHVMRMISRYCRIQAETESNIDLQLRRCCRFPQLLLVTNLEARSIINDR